ncbi:hypothetical protein DFH09DRAFT_1349193 [Mycena vulgaris]|nr:hypothetical protein DFH09DRAFT_1349193 [Mycena vulgaris]
MSSCTFGWQHSGPLQISSVRTAGGLRKGNLKSGAGAAVAAILLAIDAPAEPSSEVPAFSPPQPALAKQLPAALASPTTDTTMTPFDQSKATAAAPIAHDASTWMAMSLS